MSAETKRKETAEGRDSRGRFAKGNKLSPGRRENPHSMAIKAAREAALTVGLPTLIQAASEGDTESARTLCLLGIPKLRPIALLEPVDLSKAATVKEKAERVLEAITSGEVSGDTASVLLDLLRSMTDLDVRERLEALEQKAAQGKCGVLITPGMMNAEAWIAEAQRTVNDEPQA